MRSTIHSRTNLPGGHDEIHRFEFELGDGGRFKPLIETISLRTACGMVSHLEDGNALIEMLRAMVEAQPSEYDALVGKTFYDDFMDDGPSDRVNDIRPAFNNVVKDPTRK